MTQTFTFFGLTFSVATIVAVAAAVQWLVVLAVSRKRPLLVSSLVLALAWIGVFSSGAPAPSPAGTAEAAVLHAKKPRGSCSSITGDMYAADVKSKLGEPDETRSEEETRGPGAAMWIYRDSRCAVHILDDKVEFVD
ncbi:MAG TPA: hypothetical protein VLU46_06400 [Thermoanaerobaculia bacterium]|nr:hypothetical protein [Thermoanaerobaculia bacterium]